MQGIKGPRSIDIPLAREVSLPQQPIERPPVEVAKMPPPIPKLATPARAPVPEMRWNQTLPALDRERPFAERSSERRKFGEEAVPRPQLMREPSPSHTPVVFEGELSPEEKSLYLPRDLGAVWQPELMREGDSSLKLTDYLKAAASTGKLFVTTLIGQGDRYFGETFDRLERERSARLVDMTNFRADLQSRVSQASSEIERLELLVQLAQVDRQILSYKGLRDQMLAQQAIEVLDKYAQIQTKLQARFVEASGDEKEFLKRQIAALENKKTNLAWTAKSHLDALEINKEMLKEADKGTQQAQALLENEQAKGRSYLASIASTAATLAIAPLYAFVKAGEYVMPTVIEDPVQIRRFIESDLARAKDGQLHPLSNFVKNAAEYFGAYLPEVLRPQIDDVPAVMLQNRMLQRRTQLQAKVAQLEQRVRNEEQSGPSFFQRVRSFFGIKPSRSETRKALIEARDELHRAELERNATMILQERAPHILQDLSRIDDRISNLGGQTNLHGLHQQHLELVRQGQALERDIGNADRAYKALRPAMRSAETNFESFVASDGFNRAIAHEKIVDQVYARLEDVNPAVRDQVKVGIESLMGIRARFQRGELNQERVNLLDEYGVGLNWLANLLQIPELSEAARFRHTEAQLLQAVSHINGKMDHAARVANSATNTKAVVEHARQRVEGELKALQSASGFKEVEKMKALLERKKLGLIVDTTIKDIWNTSRLIREQRAKLAEVKTQIKESPREALEFEKQKIERDLAQYQARAKLLETTYNAAMLQIRALEVSPNYPAYEFLDRLKLAAGSALADIGLGNDYAVKSLQSYHMEKLLNQSGLTGPEAVQALVNKMIATGNYEGFKAALNDLLRLKPLKTVYANPELTKQFTGDLIQLVNQFAGGGLLSQAMARVKGVERANDILGGSSLKGPGVDLHDKGISPELIGLFRLMEAAPEYVAVLRGGMQGVLDFGAWGAVTGAAYELGKTKLTTALADAAPDDLGKLSRAVESLVAGKGVEGMARSLATDTAIKATGSFFRDVYQYGLATALADRFSLDAWNKWSKVASGSEKLVRSLAVYAPAIAAIGSTAAAIGFIAATGGVGAIPVALLAAALATATASGAGKGISDVVFRGTREEVMRQQRVEKIQREVEKRMPGMLQSLQERAQVLRSQVFSGFSGAME